MEYLDILDENGNLTGNQKERNLAHIDGDWHKVVQIFVINKDKILLQQRAMTKKSDPGKWCATASGHISAGEISINTAVKEFQEELGIKIAKENLVLIDTFKSPSITFNKENKIINNHFVDLYIVNKDINIKDTILQKSEVEQVKYFTINEFIKMVKEQDAKLTNTPVLFNKLINYLKAKI